MPHIFCSPSQRPLSAPYLTVISSAILHEPRVISPNLDEVRGKVSEWQILHNIETDNNTPFNARKFEHLKSQLLLNAGKGHSILEAKNKQLYACWPLGGESKRLIRRITPCPSTLPRPCIIGAQTLGEGTARNSILYSCGISVSVNLSIVVTARS